VLGLGEGAVTRLDTGLGVGVDMPADLPFKRAVGGGEAASTGDDATRGVAGLVTGVAWGLDVPTEVSFERDVGVDEAVSTGEESSGGPALARSCASIRARTFAAPKCPFSAARR
jgi:hypothetical protein